MLTNSRHAEAGRVGRRVGFRVALRVLLASSVSVLCAAAGPAPPEEQFAASLHEIMVRMDAGMAMSPASSVDRQFITAMLPHHQAAIDMAQLQLRYGHDMRLARIAQEIIVEQQQEMVVMQDVLRTVP